MASLTAHIMVRNEPFVRYAIRSVLPYVEKVMTWDTGSNDSHTVHDIIDEMSASDRVSAKFVQIEVDETRWTTQDWHKLRAQSADKFTKGNVRQEMIDATETDWFIIVDGDEVHYDQTMQVVRRALETASDRTICFVLPLLWLDTMKTYFRRSISGRVFRTNAVEMVTLSPNELHVDKATRKPINLSRIGRIDLRVKPYAHFEKVLKPWRRPVDPSRVKPYRWALPAVMRNDSSFVERFFEERAHATSD